MAFSLTEIDKTPVSSKLKLHLDGGVMNLPTIAFYSDKPVVFRHDRGVPYMSVPLDQCARQVLIDIENYIKSQLPQDTLKMLSHKDAIYVNMSSWCKYGVMGPNQPLKWVPLPTPFGAGHYVAYIRVSHVYCGKHKGGETCSLVMYVTELLYEPTSPHYPM